jgi:hypothetical protein
MCLNTLDKETKKHDHGYKIFVYGFKSLTISHLCQNFLVKKKLIKWYLNNFFI